MATETKVLDLSHPIGSLLLVAWQWRESTISLVQSVYGKLTKLVEAEQSFMDRYFSNTANPNLSEAGKQSANEAAFNATLAPIYRDVQADSGQALKKKIASLKANSLPRTDPADFASAIVRSDIRRIFLAMSGPGKAVTIKSDPSQQLASALLEFPPELIGLNQQDLQTLTEGFGKFAYPENAAQIAELTLGLEAVKTLLNMVEVLACDKLRMNAARLQVLIWGGTLPDSKRL